MRKISLLLLAAIFCIAAHTQDSKILVGLELNPTMASLRGNPMTNDQDSRLGFSSGLTIAYFINSNISLKSGLAYEKKGSKTFITMVDENTVVVGTQDVRNSFNYLILPMLVSYTTQGKTKLYIDAGPYFGLLISQKTRYSGSGSVPEFTSNGTKFYKSTDIGFSVGVGLYVPLSDKLLLDLGLRENLGVLHIGDSPVANGFVIKTNSLGLQVGIKFKI